MIELEYFGLLMLGISITDWLVGSQNVKAEKLADALSPHYDLQEISNATDNYIPTRFSHQPPDQSGNSGSSKLLIPYLLGSRSRARRFLVMAHSGIGKTTFMLNLFQRYIKDQQPLDHIALIPLRDPKAMDYIFQLDQSSSTILLLDGFNEDPEALMDVDSRLNQLLAATTSFNTVIITSRSHFISNSDQKGFHTYIEDKQNDPEFPLEVLYLNNFQEEDIKQYIHRKYPVWNRNKRRKALELIDRAPNLMEQPILLSFMESLLDTARDYLQTYQIYEDLVTTWIAQASISQPEELRIAYGYRLQEGLVELMQLTYERHQKDRLLSIPKSELINLQHRYGLPRDAFEQGSISMISHLPNDEVKFIHNSIMEFLLAKEVITSPELLAKVSFVGLDQGMRFVAEMIIDWHMVKVDGGQFNMGPDDQNHRVEVEDFLMAKYPVTVAEYRLYCSSMGVSMPPEPTWGWEDSAPIVNITWDEAQDYCRWLSSRTGLPMRLPTEAEWEFAARGGRRMRKHKYPGAKDINQVAWYSKNANRKTQPVGQLKPNLLDIYDLAGNCWEWCNDNHYYYLPPGPDDMPSGRSIRGGAWVNHEKSCRVYTRGFGNPNKRSQLIGMRLVCSQ